MIMEVNKLIAKKTKLTGKDKEAETLFLLVKIATSVATAWPYEILHK